MTTELVLLLSLALFIIGGVVKSPTEAFKNSGPALGARLETNLNTGMGDGKTGFQIKASNSKVNPYTWR